MVWKVRLIFSCSISFTIRASRMGMGNPITSDKMLMVSVFFKMIGNQ